MSLKFGESPERSISSHIEAVDYPTTRDLLQLSAMESGAPPELINVLKSLPSYSYDSREEVFRDLAEASRRFAMGNFKAEDDGVSRDRRNIGRLAVEQAPPPRTRHP